MSNLTIVDITTPEVVSWLASFRQLVADHYQTLPSLTPNVVKATQGSKYIKIQNGSSVTTFINRCNGDVLKAASWQAPAKHARGNIFDATNGMGMMGHYGPAYLR